MMRTLTVIAVAFTLYGSFAQAPSLSTTIDTPHIRIGEQIEVNFTVTHSKDVEVYWPEFREVFGRFEVVDAGTPETKRHDDLMRDKRTVLITSFDSGYHVLEPFVFTYRLPEADTLIPLKSEPFMVRVASVDVDTSQPFKPIVGPYSERRTLPELLPYFLVPLMTVLAALLIWWLWRSRRKAPAEPSVIPAHLTPHEWVIGRLEELDRKKQWSSPNGVKPHYVELTEVLRIYIEKQLDVPAVEQTSWEIIEGLHGKVKDEEVSKLQHLLEVADLVKFAKASPEAQEHPRCLQIGFDFVRSTIPAPAS